MAAATGVKNSIGNLLEELGASYRAADADEMESFHAQMKAEAQRLNQLDKAGKAEQQIDLNRLAKEKPKVFAKEQSEAALATLRNRLTDQSKPI